ncbi:hypothetical protein B0T26DRAFT_742078 [Lasiosphaeria miniovina]|uniref:Copper acquisition factor BIM1-like domain-containing protein n=1 Tax=Lasiosphaeria miniovina TaxID=1954250 RepID=A0AA40ACE8_9PEZI|nr:uncharacterized protein B0T26DRAFT_742078 [Lasiosphaeria miniovina]KAK0713311.1 hypothetical protein B0T26DRAFT_742078 [Lasiosphaeria miniovina]
MLSSLALLGLAVSASAHFVLQIPTSLGFDDELEATGPCGSFDPTDRSKGVSGWSVNGGNVGVLSTHTSVTWELNVALLSAPTTWLPLVQTFAQKGVGNVCFAKVPGFAAWADQDAVLQVIQHGPDGDLYQASPFFLSRFAIKFVTGGPDAVPGDCTTSSGVSIGPMIPAAGPTPSKSSSTSAPAAASFTTSTTAAAATATSAPATSFKASSSVPSDGHSHSHVHTSSSSAAATTTTATTSIVSSAAAASGNATTTTTSSKLPVVTASASASASATVAGRVVAAAAALGLLSLLLAGPIGV